MFILIFSLGAELLFRTIVVCIVVNNLMLLFYSVRSSAQRKPKYSFQPCIGAQIIDAS